MRRGGIYKKIHNFNRPAINCLIKKGNYLINGLMIISHPKNVNFYNRSKRKNNTQYGGGGSTHGKKKFFYANLLGWGWGWEGLRRGWGVRGCWEGWRWGWG